jgi:hypothetical protein
MKARLLLPGIYAVVALGAWVDFASLPPDGLADLGLLLVVLPVTLLDLALRTYMPGSDGLVPSRWGYYGDYAVFFSISVACIMLALYLLGRAID